MLEDRPRQRMVEREFRERILVGGRLAGGGLLLDRQLLALEQDLLDLLGRAEVEGLAGRVVAFCSKPRISLPSSWLCASSFARSSSTPFRSMRQSTGSAGISIEPYTNFSFSSLSIF